MVGNRLLHGCRDQSVKSSTGARPRASFPGRVLGRSSSFRFGYRSSIHIWLTHDTLPNAAMMLMLAYIIVGHPEWRMAEIRVFACVGRDGDEDEASELSALIGQGRLPIGRKNVETVRVQSREGVEEAVRARSSEADLVIAGISREEIEEGDMVEVLEGYGGANNVLFVHAVEEIGID